jgi:FkbM family methyltransferase
LTCANVGAMKKSEVKYADSFGCLPETIQPMRLIDVGCSGGIDRRFLETFRNMLVHGFDPLVEEINRLNSLELAGHKYWNYYVGATRWGGGSEISESEAPGVGTTFHLTSAFTAQESLQRRGTSYVQTVFNHGEVPSYTDKRITLDSFLSEQSDTVNFLKVDTDGNDFFVLSGAKRALADLSLLGVQVECQFHGLIGNEQNTFSNIDNLMRSNGFSLFLLEPHKYSRAELPQEFVWKLFGQTNVGQVQWAEAVYFRDPTIQQKFRASLSQDESLLINFLKLLLIFDLPDVAAATVLGVLNTQYKSPSWGGPFLDSLVPKKNLGAKSYEEYIKAFSQNPERLFPRSPALSKNQVKSLLSRLVSWIDHRY